MKQLSSLTEKEFNKLKKSGLLNTIYPDAPESYSILKGKRPKPKTNPDFSSLIALCEQYLDFKQDPDNNYMKDTEHYIYEEAITCIYGENNESGVWDFINLQDN